MFEPARQRGADQILELARRVTAELAHAAGRSIRVVGWCGSTGKMGWEYVVEIDGHGWNLEVGDSDLLTFPVNERVRAEVEERIRQQLRYALGTAGPSARY
jgi:tripartite-type tricarboxylate transporter receptor subunit TctC